MNVEHIGIAVNNLEKSRRIYEKLFPESSFSEWLLEDQGIKVLIMHAENLKVELIEPIHDDSPISKFLAKRGEGLHHIAYLTNDMEAKIKQLRNEGFSFLTDTYYTGAENYKVIFVSPKETGRVLTELCQRT